MSEVQKPLLGQSKKIKQYMSDYYVRHKTKILVRAKKYRRAHREEIARYKLANRERALQYQKEYHLLHKERAKKYRIARRVKVAKHKRERWRSDPQFKVSCVLRKRLSMALLRYRRGSKVVSAVRDCGCTVDEVVRHIESLWKPGMTWANYGKGDCQWSIDHIVPLASFDLSDREQALRAVNYKNLQPMWHIDNIKKGDSVPTGNTFEDAILVPDTDMLNHETSADPADNQGETRWTPRWTPRLISQESRWRQ